MPDINNTFMSGKMNKDLDERLVPKHHYRDAQNIEVSTSKGSDVGALQNSYGNTSRSSISPYIGKSKCVGSIVDTENDKIYWFVKGAREELVKNGNFNNDDFDSAGLTNWSVSSDGVSIDTVNGNITLGEDNSATGIAPHILQNDLFEIGKEYTLTFNVVSITTSVHASAHTALYFRTVDNSGNDIYPAIPGSDAVGKVSYTFTAMSTRLYLGSQQLSGNSGQYWNATTIDNVSIKKQNVDCIAEYDYKTEITEPVLVDSGINADGNIDEDAKFLKFTDQQITGISILDGMLFWSDGENEPKKINIEHCKGGSNKNISGDQSEKLNWTTTTQQRDFSGQVVGNFLEKDITVIKKYPLNAPSLALSDTIHGEPDLNAKSKSICVVPQNTTYQYNRSHFYGSNDLEMYNQPLFMKVSKHANWAGMSTNNGGFTPQYSLYFDGTDDYVSIGSGAQSAVSTNSFTIMGRFRMERADSADGDLDKNMAFVGKNTSGGSNIVIFGVYDESGQRKWHINIRNDSHKADNSLVDYPVANTWYHVAVTAEESGGNTTSKFYINGVLASTYTHSTVLTPTDSGDKPIILGAEHDGSGTPANLSDWFRGYMKDVGFWNVALDQDNITAMYNNNYSLTYNGQTKRDFNINFDNYTQAANCVCAYDFNEGYSTSLGDVTGSGFNGTINGASWKMSHNRAMRWSRRYQLDIDVLNTTPWSVPISYSKGIRWPIRDSWHENSEGAKTYGMIMDLRQDSDSTKDGYRKFRSSANGRSGYYSIYAISNKPFTKVGNSHNKYVRYVGTTDAIDGNGRIFVHTWRDHYYESDSGYSYVPQKDDILMFWYWDAFKNQSFWTYREQETNEVVPKPPGTSNTPKLDKEGRWLRDYVGNVNWIFPRLETEAQQGAFHYQSRANDFDPGWIGDETGYVHSKDASYSASDYRYVENIVYNIPTANPYHKGITISTRATVEIIDIDTSVYLPGTTSVFPVGIGDPLDVGRNNGVSNYARVPKSAGVGEYVIGTYFNDQSDLPDTVNQPTSSYYNGENQLMLFCHKGVTARIKNIEIQYYGARPVRIQDLNFVPKPNFQEGDVVKLTNQTDSTVQIQLKLKKEKTGLEYSGATYGYSAPLDLNSGYTRGSNMIHADANLTGSISHTTPNNMHLYWTNAAKIYGTSAGNKHAAKAPEDANDARSVIDCNKETEIRRGWFEYNAAGNDTDFKLEPNKTYELVYTIEKYSTSPNDDNVLDRAKLYLYGNNTTQANSYVLNSLLLPSSVGTHRVFFNAYYETTNFRIAVDRGFICDTDFNECNSEYSDGTKFHGDANSYFRGKIHSIELYPITVTNIDYGNYGSNANRSTFECEILSISDDIVKLDYETQRYWDAELTELESIYKFRFPRFAYRWRYKDGEYSAMSPFTEVAFLPGDEYEFDAIDSYNKTMLNTVRRITLGDFQNKPAGVKQLDILVKDSDSPNIYKFASIRGDELSNLTDYVITSEQYEGLLESAQLLRHFDNVPRKAKAQEISSNRLIYGNYTQQYDILDSELPNVSAELSSRYIKPKETNKSIKSIRNYQVGIAYIDQYGRQTPVFSTPNGVVKIQKESSLTANQIVANVNNDPPSWATHMKYYVKDAATEYYNLSLDRHYYDDDDEHIWMSFASSDFNKIESDDYIILKKEHDGDKSIVDKSRYKILAKEANAPDFVKFVKRQLGERVYAENGQSLQFTASAVGFPQVGKTTFRMAGNDIHNHSFLAQPDIEGVEPRGALMDDQTGRFIKIGKEVNNEVVSMTSYYEILSVSRVNGSSSSNDTDFSDSEDYYEFTLIEPFTADIGFVGAHNDSNPENKGLFLEYYEESDRVDSDAFEGRFFVKIKKDGEILKRISDKNNSAASTNTLVTAAANMFWAHTFDLNIRNLNSYTGSANENGKDGDITLLKKAWFDWQSDINAPTDGIYNSVAARHNTSGNTLSPTKLHSFFYQAIFGHDGWITEPSTNNDWNSRIYDLDPNDDYRLISNPYFGDHSAGTAHPTQNASNYYAPATDGTWKRSHYRGDDYQEGNQKFCIDQSWAFGWPTHAELYDGQDLTVENNALGTGFVIGRNYCCFRVINIGAQTNLSSITVDGSESGEVLYARGANTFDDFSLTAEFFDDIKVVKALTTPGTKFRWSNDPTNTVYTVSKVINTGKVKNYHNVEQQFNYGDLVDWNTAQAYEAADHSSAINGFFVADYGLSYHPPSSMQWGMHSRSNQGYRIAIELDKNIVWSPTSSTYGGGQTPMKRLDQLTSSTTDSEAFSSLEIISSGASADGGYSTDNPAIFEVEPIDNTDYNLYYEASNTSIVLKTGMKVEALNNINVNDSDNGAGGGNYSSAEDVGTTYAPGGTAVLSSQAKIVVDRPGEFFIDKNTWDPQIQGQLPAGITLRVSKLDANGEIEYFEDFIAKTGISSSIGENLVLNHDFTEGASNFDNWSNGSIMSVDATSQEGVIVETGSAIGNYPNIHTTDPISIVSGEVYQLDFEVLEMDNDVFDDVPGTGEYKAVAFITGSQNTSYRPIGNRVIKEGVNSYLFKFDQSQNEDNDNNPVSSIRLYFEMVNIKGGKKRMHLKNCSIRLMGDTVDTSDRPIRWHNCYTFGNGVESDRLRDDFNAVKIDKGPKVSTTLDEPYEEENRKNGLIYSGLYNSKTGFNKLNEFIMGLKITKDVNPEYGSLQKLFSRNTDLVAFCEDKVLRILSNKDALYNADGNPQVVSTNMVLGQAVPFAGDYGISKNPESFVSFGYRAYFTDKARGAVLRLSMDGLTPISDAGMSRFFKDNLPFGSEMIGSYDQDKDLYNLTINGFTVSFAESVNGWTSFKSFLPESGVSLNGSYYTFKNGDIWKHNDNEVRNNFYGVQYESSVKFLLNDASSIVKDFKTLSYEGSDSKTDTTSGWYSTSITTDMDAGQVIEFKNKEGKKFSNIIGTSTDETTIELDSNSTQGLGLLDNIQMGGYGKFYPLNIKGEMVDDGASVGGTTKWLLNTSTDAENTTTTITNNYEQGEIFGVGGTLTHEFYIHPKTLNEIDYAVDASNFTVTSSDSARVTVVATTNTTTGGEKDNKIKITISVEYPSGDEFPDSEQTITLTVQGYATLAIN